MNVIFVCLGNICRSPLAEGIMRRIYETEKICGLIESAGTMDWNAGNCADQRAIKVAKANGIDLTRHRARQFQTQDFERFDIIFVMDNSNANSLRKIAPKAHSHKIQMLGGEDEIADPYYQDEAAFHETYTTIDALCRKAIKAKLAEEV